MIELPRWLAIFIGGLRCGLAKTFMVVLLPGVFLFDAAKEGWLRAHTFVQWTHYHFHESSKTDEEREEEAREAEKQRVAYEKFMQNLGAKLGVPTEDES